MKINDFYQYVFGNWATIDVSKIPVAKQNQARLAKQEKIKTEFQSITENTQLSAEFRNTLRQLKAHNLEDILYDNHTDEIELKANNISDFPNDDEILEEYEGLNDEYKYFAAGAQVEKTFIAIFKACKLMGDYVERNNTRDNEVAFNHAYKILVLFGAQEKNPFSLTEAFLAKHASQFDKPIHD
ncbi:MAG TPA: hypothetical protein VHA13_03585, partial [Gammaproteobacteria bacterium]|nr:hypothetical protein [Gammaproteobacteria bacterium]